MRSARRRTLPIDQEWSEQDLQNAILDVCRLYDLLAYHTHDSRRSQPGYPDLTIVGPRGVLFVELKSATGQLELEQEKWRQRLIQADAQWRLWRPADWFGRTILDELAALRHAPHRGRPGACADVCAEGHTYVPGECEATAPSAEPWKWPAYPPPPPGMPARPAPPELGEFDPSSGHRRDCPPLDRDVCGCASQLYVLAKDHQEADWLRAVRDLPTRPAGDR